MANNKQPKSKKRKLFLLLLLFIIIVIIGYFWIASSDVGGLLGLLPPLISKRSSYMGIIHDIENGKLKAENSVIYLPHSYHGVAPRNEVYYQLYPDGRMFVLFPTWYGRGQDINGYLYCSGTLNKEDYFISDWGSGGISQEIHLCGISYLEPKYVKEHWYKIIRRLD